MTRYIKTVLFAAVFIIFLAGQTKAAGQGKLDIALDEKKLLSRELQVFTQEYKVEGEGKKKRVIGVLLLNAPPAAVWNVIKDWDSLTGLMDSLEYYKTRHVFTPISKGNIGDALIEGKLKVAFFFNIYYTLRVLFDEPGLRQEWKLVTDEQAEKFKKMNIEVKESSAGIKAIEGFEYIEPFDNGSKTIFYYAPLVEVSIPVPGFVDRAVSKSSLEEFMNAIKEKIESMKKPEPGK